MPFEHGQWCEATLDVDPYFSSEAQESFVVGCRVWAPDGTNVVGNESDGTYEGRSKHGAFVRWDTPGGNGFTESVPFDRIRNLYR